MFASAPQGFLTALCLLSTASAQIDSQLTGTWSSKSNKVFTGPGFYDPVNEKLIEPSLPGISYSFTDDGHYEEAYYRAIPNPTLPSCPKGVMQFQHGTFTKAANGSLQLTPFGVDGRQLLSDPCRAKNSVLTRYIQPELIDHYQVITDPYHNIPRLNLFQFDGSPMQPLYLAYRPPQMLPTITMNPTSTASGVAKATGKVKRDGIEETLDLPLNKNAIKRRRALDSVDTGKWWWIGVGMTALGAIGFFCF